MTAKIKVLRAFQIDKDHVAAVGEEVEIPDDLALTVLLAGKAEAADDDTRERYARVVNAAQWSAAPPEVQRGSGFVFGYKR